jgi:GTP-binding protein
VERTKVLIHLIDAWSDDVVQSYKTIVGELKAYKMDLSSKPQIVALSKIDGLDQDIIDDQTAQLQAVLPKGQRVFAISALSHTGTQELLYAVLTLVQEARAVEAEEASSALPVIGIKEDEQAWKITKEDDVFVVRGRKIERFVQRAHTDTEEGQRRIRDIMGKMGILSGLQRQGIEAGQTIRIGRDYTLEY